MYICACVLPGADVIFDLVIALKKAVLLALKKGIMPENIFFLYLYKNNQKENIFLIVLKFCVLFH